MLVYDISNIIEINKDMMTYINENGNKQYIDFNECRSNWVLHVNESKDYITWEGEPVKNISESNTNCVGHRDWFSEKPYYEFFVNPFVRFEIRPKRKFWEIINKRWLQRYYPSFHAIEKKLNEAGWSTFDLG